MEIDNEILEKLHSITEKEWREIMDNLTKWVYFKLKGRILFGAHSEQILGIIPSDYYVVGAIEKLFSLEWKWQFEKYTIFEQLQRIVGSMMFENIRKYKTKKEEIILMADEELITIIENNSVEEYDDETYQSFLDALSECTNDDDDLQLYSLAMLECNSFDEMSNELGWDKPKLYVLQRKLGRRMIKYFENKKNN
jgi:hypothetical protein